MEMNDSTNTGFQQALRFVTQTGQHIFLTGRAGTGKTTFLKKIRDGARKNIAVVAPTGVAAINAGGVTMHSFFQLPFRPFIPVRINSWQDQAAAVDEYALIKNIRFSQEKRELLRELDLLVIDEVSMLRADMLDAIDRVLRYFRFQPNLPFGGLQVLYIGDLFQLPPVVVRNEWEILSPYYKSPFFFDAHVIQQAPPVYIELKKIYRQSDIDFIHILNNIRNNQATQEDLESLHHHYSPGFKPAEGENFITLTTHNSRADLMNQQELDKLPGPIYVFDGKIEGDFEERALPAEKILSLKPGAQIMFIKNDKGEDRRYFNGKIGRINRIQADNIFISFENENDELLLEKENWKNIRYNFNKEKGRIEEETLGEFTQYPIRLAWAITIHKSQGLTFEKAIIDAGASFAPGQVYVALSRLTSIKGLVLYSRIRPDCIQTDPRILDFAKTELGEEKLHTQFLEHQKAFIIRFISQLFNWDKLVKVCQEHLEDYDHRMIPEKFQAIKWAEKLMEEINHQKSVSIRFKSELDFLLTVAELDGYANLQKRITAACDYYVKQLDQVVEMVKQHKEDMRLKQRVKKYLKELNELILSLQRKKQQVMHAMHVVTGLMNGIKFDDLLSFQAQPTTKENIEIKTKPQKGDSRKISLQLFREKKTIDEIASMRGFARVTIETHLMSFIPSGEIEVRELMSEDKVGRIIEALSEINAAGLTALKERLGEEYSYNEIRAVIYHFDKLQRAKQLE
ncbi:MAG: helicase [Bacteroidetes bacterium]|nr:MAG: helicase [Bacteroidota bacterium]